MGSMTDVALATPVAGGPNWTLVFTATGVVSCSIQNRTSDSDVLLRVNGSVGAASDPLNAAAKLVRPYDRVALSLASGDLVYARLANANPAVPITGRVTVRV
jgi:hypothetical protein